MSLILRKLRMCTDGEMEEVDTRKRLFCPTRHKNCNSKDCAWFHIEDYAGEKTARCCPTTSLCGVATLGVVVEMVADNVCAVLEVADSKEAP